MKVKEQIFEVVKLCPACESKKLKKLFKAKDYNQKIKGNFGVIRCDNCGIALTSPRPKQKQIGKFYPDFYWGDSETPRKEIINNYKEIYTWIKENAKKSTNKILDIGAGGGYFLSIFDEKFDKYGIEYSKNAASMGSRKFKLKILPGNLSKNMSILQKGTFDFITMNNVLEHIYKPANEIRMIKKLLSEKGVVIISVPNFDSLNSKLFKQYWYHLDVPRHIVHYNCKNLKKMLEENGLKVIKVDYNYFVHNAVGFRNSYYNKNPRIGKITYKVIEKLSIFIAKISPSLKCSDVVTIYAVNEK